MNKKILIIVLVIVLILAVLAGAYVVLSKKPQQNANIAGSTEELMTKLYAGVTVELPKLGNTAITKDNMKYYLGIDNIEFVDGTASEPFIGSIPYSVVLLRVKEGTDIEKAKKDIKENVDPRKWICVGVEEQNVIVDNKGDLIVLIMDNEAPTKLHEAFKAIK